MKTDDIGYEEMTGSNPREVWGSWGQLPQFPLPRKLCWLHEP